jgi:hypothetical protein
MIHTFSHFLNATRCELLIFLPVLIDRFLVFWLAYLGLDDSILLSAVDLSPDWIAAQYRSLTDQFVGFGAPENDVLDVLKTD